MPKTLLSHLRNPLFALLLIGVLAQPILADNTSIAGLTKKEAIRIAQQRNGGGKVLAVSESNKKGKRVFEIKLISAGKVRILTVRDQ